MVSVVVQAYVVLFLWRVVQMVRCFEVVIQGGCMVGFRLVV